jgi:hypothetical protein
MIRAFALLMAVAGCKAQIVTVPPRPHIDLPHYCQLAPKPPQPLGQFVTTAQLRAWAEATESARRETAARLNKCVRRLRDVME